MYTKLLIAIIITTTLLLNLATTNADEPTVLISEIAWMGTATSSNDEWIELYNPTDTDIDLTDWKLAATDGSPSITLSGQIKTHEFFILERTDDDTLPTITADQIYSGSLSNTGEWLKLTDANNNLIDEINATTDGWPGGDNTSKQTLERLTDLTWQTSQAVGGNPKQINDNSGNNNNDNQNDNSDNQDTNNQQTDNPPQPTVAPLGTSNVKKNDIVFNEIFPNSSQPNKADEFFELKNISIRTIDLTSWQIVTSAKQIFTMPSVIMSPQSIVVFYHDKTNLALNDLDETLKLKDKKGHIINQIDFNDSIVDQSFSRDDNNNYLWAEPTPGQKNILPEQKVGPTIIAYLPKQASSTQPIIFDASDSFTPNDSELKFNWQFGDGNSSSQAVATNAYDTPDKYTVTLTVGDDVASTTKTFSLKIISEATTTQATTTPAKTDGDPNTLTQPISPIITQIPDIFISEFLADPAGADDTGEFIELFSQELAPYDLAGWQIDDADGGSKPYIIPDNTIIHPGQYLAFFRPETKIALNNSNDAMRLLTPDGQVVDNFDYEKTKEGQSYARDQDFNWQQSQTPTPNEINVLDVSPAPTSTATTTEAQPRVLGAATEDLGLPSKNNNQKYLIAFSFAALIIGFFTGTKFKKPKSIA
ncbi:MAG: lamin tail domain-containing protein [Candidatus Buchananbacteria bacterium]|nr:lamin tail domain-containing protein [Candidatus Buchananbacteria bacterium]